MKDKTSYVEIIIYSLIVLLLIAISVSGYRDGQAGKASAGVIPDVLGIAVDYWASEPTEVQPPLFCNIVSGIPYKARITKVSLLQYPLPGESMDCMADMRCRYMHGIEGYACKVTYDKYGGRINMPRWLFIPPRATPPVVEHDLLLMGATSPTECNGYYNEAGIYNDEPYYKHATEEYYIWWAGDIAQWCICSNLGDYTHIYFYTYTYSVIANYDSMEGTGAVVVYPVNLSLSGATSPAECNGTYTEAGTLNGKPYYVHTSGDYKITFENIDFPVWYVTDATISSYYFRFERDDTLLGPYITFSAGEGNVTVSMP